MPSLSLVGGSFDGGVRIWLWELLSSVSNNRTFVGFRALFWRRLDRHPEPPSRDPVEVTLKLRQRHPSLALGMTCTCRNSRSHWTTKVCSRFVPDAKSNVPDSSGRAYDCNRSGADRAAKIPAAGYGLTAAEYPNRRQNSGRKKSPAAHQSSCANAGRNHYSNAGGQESAAALRHGQHGYVREACGRFLYVCQWRLDQTHPNSPGIFPLGQLQSVNRKK